jgi:Protein of unknown function (DUF2950)
MKSRTLNLLPVLMAATLISALVVISDAAPAPAPAPQKGFATPQDAVKALVNATEIYNIPALLEIFGPGGEDLVVSKDPIADRNRAADFVEAAHQKQSVVTDPQDPGRAELVVGNDEWPLPIPLVNRNGKWYFDTASGRREILLRRIGENELDAIQVCRGYVEAQQDYALDKHDASELNEYAQQIIATPGKHNGLAWRNEDGTWGGPVGEEIAGALEQGYDQNVNPYHGYYYKVLKGQGPSAPLGQIDFVVRGAMIGGFALAAAPAQYRVTGVKTFIVSHDGIVYEKDLGPNTLTIFKAMERYDPDKTWQETHDDE